MLELYKRIKKRRLELDMTQDELAKRLGYKSRSSINKIELGLNDIPQSKIVAFANALNTSPDYLMGWSDSVASKSQLKPILDDEETRVVLGYRSLNDDGKALVRNMIAHVQLIMANAGSDLVATR